MSANRGILKLCTRRTRQYVHCHPHQRIGYIRKLSTTSTNALLLPNVRHKSSSAVPNRVMDENAAKLTSNHLVFDEVLPKADWALHSYRIHPREDLSGSVSRGEMIAKGALDLLLDLDSPQETPEKLEEQAFDKHSMSEEEINQWLEGYPVPEERLAQCKTPEEVHHMRLTYARQIRLECSVYDMAMERREASVASVRDLGRASHMNAAKNLLIQWMEPAKKLIALEQKQLRDGQSGLDRGIYGPGLLMLDPEVYAAVSINIMLNLSLMEPAGTKFIKLALAVGKAVQEEIIHKKQSKPKYYMNMIKSLKNPFVKARLDEYYHNVGLWDKRVNLKVGAALIDLIQRSCMIPEKKKKSQFKEATEKNNSPSPKEETVGAQPAFLHGYTFERNRRAGVIKCHEEILKVILDGKAGANCLPWTARYLPMLVPPKDWTFVTNGGYLKLHTKIMRQRDSAWQMDCVKRGELEPLYKSLNLLSSVPWVINEEVLDVILHLWKQGGGFGDLPQREDIPIPECKPEYYEDEEKMAMYEKMCKKVAQKNQELHSLRCDTLYKLQVAEEFRDEKEVYFPYNMDFRGRVYPIPPNLNHLGSDLSRSLLIFRDKKPLGKTGLRWLKIHLANVFGVDKCSFDERVLFTEANLEKALASAADPYGEGDHAWWKQADYPFLALGVCFELKRALDSPNPEEYMSNIPVHQDGSCNGLQHYAALGRDASGGQQVNLLPASRPSDVYTGVAEQVMKKVERDAHMEIVVEGKSEKEIEAQRRRKVYATFLLGTITRKVVKQTVMTSVYGVTYIGARKQIQARLEETFLTKGHLMDSDLEDKIYHASCYAAETTIESMGDLFTSARSIMEWLSDCASKVAQEGQPMSWITPLGLPVVQPYRKCGSQQIRTKVQHVLLTLSEQRPVSGGRQKTAFPPNFVHSLDSTHMLMTAQKCVEEDEIAFAAVHDSYWTHACSVDTMNARLRQEFVHLYEQPLLDELLQQLRLRFPKTEFKEIPQLGELDLKQVLKSPYFFN